LFSFCIHYIWWYSYFFILIINIQFQFQSIPF
jgi:hypothetical protein